MWEKCRSEHPPHYQHGPHMRYHVGCMHRNAQLANGNRDIAHLVVPPQAANSHPTIRGDMQRTQWLVHAALTVGPLIITMGTAPQTLHTISQGMQHRVAGGVAGGNGSRQPTIEHTGMQFLGTVPERSEYGAWNVRPVHALSLARPHGRALVTYSKQMAERRSLVPKEAPLVYSAVVVPVVNASFGGEAMGQRSQIPRAARRGAPVDMCMV